MGSLTKQLIGKEDLSIQYNANDPEQFSRLNSVGGTINLYQIPDMWTYTGALRIGDIITKGPWVDVRAYGAVGDGVTDDSTAIQNAISAAQTANATVLFPSGGPWCIGTKLVISRPLTVIGQGRGSVENSGYYASQTIIKWIGAATGTMLDIGDGADTVSAVKIEGTAFNGNNLAGVGIHAKAMTHSKIEVLIYNCEVNSIAMKLEALASKNVMFNDLYLHLAGLSGVNNQGLVMVDTADSNCCWNRFYNLRVEHQGNSAGVVVKGDNNSFFGLFIYRVSGTGYGMEIGSANPACLSNYIFHGEFGLGGLHITSSSSGNTVYGYDLGNGAPVAVVDSGSYAYIHYIQGTNLLTSITGLHSISKGNTHGYNLAGFESVTITETSVAVTFLVNESDTNYLIVATPNWSTTCYVTLFAVTGFTINFGTAAPAGAGVGWIIIRL